MANKDSGKKTDSKTNSKTNPDLNKKASGGFDLFFRFFSALAPGTEAEREKKSLLKGISKELKKHKHKFYKSKTKEALPGLARFFYSVYKTITPAQLLIEETDSSNKLKAIVINYFLTERQHEVIKDLDESVIRQKAGQMDAKALADEYKEKMIGFFSDFNTQKISQIDSIYNLLIVFLKLIHFDYYFLLKKFDSKLVENDFKFRAQFVPINGQYLTEDLKDFLEVLPLIHESDDWATLFKMLDGYKGTSVISEPAWKNTMKSLQDVSKSGILELIIRHMDEDPFFSHGAVKTEHVIIDAYLQKMKSQAEITMQKILHEKKREKIGSLSARIFGTSAVSRLRNYTEKANLTFAKRMLGGFIHVDPLNYVKAFLTDFVKIDVKELVDLLLIKGQWSTTVFSQQLSESSHQLAILSDRLTDFDESLSEDGETGRVIANAFQKTDQDKSMIKVVRQYLGEVNKQAFGIMKESVANLVLLAKQIKSVLEDRKEKGKDLILNWREIEISFDKNIDEALTTIYQKIYYFSQLLQPYLK